MKGVKQKMDGFKELEEKTGKWGLQWISKLEEDNENVPVVVIHVASNPIPKESGTLADKV